MVLERGGLLIAHYPVGPDDTLRSKLTNTFTSSHGPIRFAVRDGRAVTLTLGDSSWPRRPLGQPGSVFRIKPVRPVAALRREAIAATPPTETGEFRPTDLVELVRLDSTIRLDIRYAGTRNFLATPVYTQARAFLQRPAALAVARIHRRLRGLGLGLLIHDGYRPWYVTRIFWDATPAAQHEFVADPAQGSRHNRGCAVDLSLYDLKTGRPIDMPGVYDEFSHRSYPDYPGGTSRQRWYRDLLRREMEADGFTINTSEWWHFDYKDWKTYRIGNVPFEGIRD
jgi:D-alanyl-D-alanine dipeptidase